MNELNEEMKDFIITYIQKLPFRFVNKNDKIILPLF
jgi:hypothetical protein